MQTFRFSPKITFDHVFYLPLNGNDDDATHHKPWQYRVPHTQQQSTECSLLMCGAHWFRSRSSKHNFIESFLFFSSHFSNFSIILFWIHLALDVRHAIRQQTRFGNCHRSWTRARITPWMKRRPWTARAHLKFYLNIKTINMKRKKR